MVGESFFLLAVSVNFFSVTLSSVGRKSYVRKLHSHCQGIKPTVIAKVLSQAEWVVCVLLMGHGCVFCSRACLLLCWETRLAALFMDSGTVVQLKGSWSYTDDKPCFKIIVIPGINWTVELLVD